MSCWSESDDSSLSEITVTPPGLLHSVMDTVAAMGEDDQCLMHCNMQVLAISLHTARTHELNICCVFLGVQVPMLLVLGTSFLVLQTPLIFLQIEEVEVSGDNGVGGLW